MNDYDRKERPPEFEPLWEHLRDVPGPDPKRKAAAKAEFMMQVRRAKHQPSFNWWRAAAIAVFVLAALLISAGGTAYAADSAAPGDPLYAVDQQVEAIRFSLASSVDAKVQLQQAFANERLQEAAELADANRIDDMQVALEGYRAHMSMLQGRVTSEELADHRQILDDISTTVAADEQAAVDQALDVLNMTVPSRPPATMTPTARPPVDTPVLPTVAPTNVVPTQRPHITPPGQQVTPPGQEKTPPGQQVTPPGQEKTPPGQQVTPPGQEKTPPDQGGSPPGGGKGK